MLNSLRWIAHQLAELWRRPLGYRVVDRAMTGVEARDQDVSVSRPNGSTDRVPSRVQARDEPCADPVNCDVHRATTAPQSSEGEGR